MRARRAVAAGAALLLLAGTASACDGGDAGPERLVIAAGGAGDVYLALGQALAETARDELTGEVRVLETGGSIDNLREVAEGRADVGFATVDATSLAVQGEGPQFPYALPVVALGRLYDDYLQVVVRADSQIGQVSDLSGRAVSTGPAGSGTQIVASRVLEAAGHDITRVHDRQLPLDRSVEALGTGEVMGVFVTGGLPMPALRDLAVRVPLRLLTLEDGEIADLQARFGEHYQARTIPARTYSLEENVETLGVANVLVVRRGLPERTAYWLTELLFAAKPHLVGAHEEARRLDQRSALGTYPVQLHPGAATYYRDHKVMAAVRPAAA
jgi:TRAP transporter TAXI family solute receptor